jgi:hypothetical protein
MCSSRQPTIAISPAAHHHRLFSEREKRDKPELPAIALAARKWHDEETV